MTIPFVLFYQDPANTAWLFEKFLFELEAFYSFKITCTLVRQVISLKKKGGVINQNCTPLILVSASVKMVGTSATVTYNSIRQVHPGELLYTGKRLK